MNRRSFVRRLLAGAVISVASVYGLVEMPREPVLTVLTRRILLSSPSPFDLRADTIFPVVNR